MYQVLVNEYHELIAKITHTRENGEGGGLVAGVHNKRYKCVHHDKHSEAKNRQK